MTETIYVVMARGAARCTVAVARTAGKAREIARSMLPSHGIPCEACGERSARGQERPDDECLCECHGPAAQIEAWDGSSYLDIEMEGPRDDAALWILIRPMPLR